jgi:hypothetical protein
MTKATTKPRRAQTRLSFTKETTHFYRFDAPDESAAVTAVYVRKTVFGTASPAWILLTVEESLRFSGPAADDVRGE